MGVIEILQLLVKVATNNFSLTILVVLGNITESVAIWCVNCVNVVY